MSAAVRVRDDDLFRYVLRLGDLSLVLGQRLGEWVGHSPALEEDLGLANMALDLIGQARLLLGHAGEIEGRGRDVDKLAFLREPEPASDSLDLHGRLVLAVTDDGVITSGGVGGIEFAREVIRVWDATGEQLVTFSSCCSKLLTDHS